MDEMILALHGGDLLESILLACSVPDDRMVQQYERHQCQCRCKSKSGQTGCVRGAWFKGDWHGCCLLRAGHGNIAHGWNGHVPIEASQSLPNAADRL
jgi:hypothetical protein